MKLFNTLLLFFVFLFSGNILKAQEVPKSMPDFSFQRYSNETIFSKSGLKKGMKTVFIFLSPECAYCQEEVIDINKNINLFKNTNLIFVSVYSKAEVNAFFNRYGKNILTAANAEILYDKNQLFIYSFNPTSYPNSYVYDKKGKLIKFINTFNIAELYEAIK